jgi:hypothetical protein
MLRQQAQRLYEKLEAERVRLRPLGTASARFVRVALLADEAYERVQRRQAKCNRCGKPLEPTDHDLCETCWRVTECW